MVHDAIAAGVGTAEHAAMVDRANNWAATLDQSITTPRAPRGRGAVSQAAQAALNAAPGVAPWVEPDGWTPPRTPGGRIRGGPHSHSQTMFSVGGHSYWTMHDFLQNPAEVQASYGRLDRYQRPVGPVDAGLVRAAKKVFEYTDPQTGLRAEVSSVTPSGSYGQASISVNGYIRDANGRSVGTFTRTMYGDGKVYHNYFRIERAQQGSGFQSRWFEQQLLPQYALNGFSKVTVSANIDVGGYAWAKQGFDFESDATRRRFLADAQAAMAGGVGYGRRVAASYKTQKARDDLAELQRRADLGEKITALEISQIGKNPRGRAKFWFGKRLMLGTSWSGVLQL